MSALLAGALAASLPPRAWANAASVARPVAPMAGAAPVVVFQAAAPPSLQSAPTLTAPSLSVTLPSPAAPRAAAQSALPGAAQAVAARPAAVAAAPTAFAAQLPASPSAEAAPGLKDSAAASQARRETSGDRLSSISRAHDAAPLWTGSAPRGASAAEPVTFDAQSPVRAGSLLAAPAARSRANAAAEPARAPAQIVIPAQSLRQRLGDAWAYASITGSSLWWYTGPRLFERWGEIKETLAGRTSGTIAVRNLMGFFIAHRVLGSTGSYAPMGFRVAANRVVVADAWSIYDAYFKEDAASREAFARLIERAERYNPNRRSTQFRKVIFHALREASVMDPRAVPAFLDGLLTEDKSRALASYQADEQPKVLAAFERMADEVILELNAGLAPGRRVVAAVLLGSFANGAAGPGSDFDVQTVSEDGGTAYNNEFLKRLKARWKAEGYPSHPVSGFQYALPISKPLVTRVHTEPYRVISPYPEVAAALSTPAEEMKGSGTLRTLRGLAFVWAYSAVLLGVLLGYEAWSRVSRPFKAKG